MKNLVVKNQINHQGGADCPAYSTTNITNHIITKAGNPIGIRTMAMAVRAPVTRSLAMA